MPSTNGTDTSTPSPIRLVAGLGLAAVMLGLAAIAASVFLVAPLGGLDDPGQDSRGIEIAAAALAVVLFIGSGPAASLVSRRRWALGVPVAVLAIWGLGIVLATST